MSVFVIVFFSSLCFITISFSLVAPFEAFVSVRRCVFVCDRNVRRSNEVVYMLEIGLIICKMQMWMGPAKSHQSTLCAFVSAMKLRRRGSQGASKQ